MKPKISLLGLALVAGLAHAAPHPVASQIAVLDALAIFELQGKPPVIMEDPNMNIAGLGLKTEGQPQARDIVNRGASGAQFRMTTSSNLNSTPGYIRERNARP